MKIALPPKLLKLLNTAYTAFTAYTAYTASTAYINAHGIWQFDRNSDEHKMGEHEKVFFVNIIML